MLNANPIRPLLRVLFIEDSEDDQVLVARELRKQGYELQMGRVDSREALESALDRQEWDVILSDYYLPGLTVREALQITRARRLDLPFIIVSGSVGEEKAIECMRHGAHDYIFKDSLGRLGPAIAREIDEAANRRERRRAEMFIGDLNRDLQRRVTELQTILSLVPVGIAITDSPDCRVIKANPALERMLGLPGGTNISLSAPASEQPPFRIRMGGAEVPVQELPMQRAAQGSVVYGEEIEFLLDNGASMFFLSSAVPLLDEKGAPRGAVGAFADITEMKRAEVSLRNSEKLATVGRLAATIAHEINNPLEAVTNVLYLLERAPHLPPQAGELVSVAQKEMQRISMIVKQTLGFQREGLAPTRFSVADLFDEVLSLYLRKLESLNIRVERDYRSKGEVEGSAGQLRQVFSNLIINAADAIVNGGRICIRIRDQAAPKAVPMVDSPGESATQRVRVSIGDTGPGIADASRRRLFEPFFTTKGEKGTGLGLWVSSGIIAKHGGSIRLRTSTRHGRSGTVFSIVLPRAAEGTAKDASSSAST